MIDRKGCALANEFRRLVAHIDAEHGRVAGSLEASAITYEASAIT